MGHPIATETVVWILMEMVQVMHRTLEVTIGVLNRAQTCGQLTQLNGLIRMETDTVTMDQSMRPILIRSRTTTLLP